jgi:hypothetical protein
MFLLFGYGKLTGHAVVGYMTHWGFQHLLFWAAISLDRRCLRQCWWDINSTVSGTESSHFERALELGDLNQLTLHEEYGDLAFAGVCCFRRRRLFACAQPQKLTWSFQVQSFEVATDPVKVD